MAGLTSGIKAVARRLGAEITRTGLATRADLRLQHLLGRLQPDEVLDAGANIGQFATDLLAGGWSGSVLSFEALPDAHAVLTEAARAHDRWSVAPRAALADSNGETDFHVTAADTASSMFPTSADGRASYAVLGPSSILRVPMRRLDDLLAEMPQRPASYFLKLDVQGAEELVLAGAPQTLERTRGVLCEMQMSSLYDGQADWRALDALLVAQGFVLWDIDAFFRSPANGRLENADFFYVRQEWLERCK